MEAAVEGIEPILDRFCQVVIPKQHCPPILTHNLLVTGDEQRCGMPSEESFAEDRYLLQLRFIYPPSWEAQTFRSRYVSSFGILRDQFRSFFGDESALSVEASGCAHSVASTTYSSDGSNILCAEDGVSDVLVCSDVSNDIFFDAHELSRKRSCSVGSQSLVRKAIWGIDVEQSVSQDRVWVNLTE